MKTKKREPRRQAKTVDNQFCPNTHCPDYGTQGRGNVYVTTTYANGQRNMLRCRTCGSRFAETRNTPLFHLHYPKERVAQVFKALAEGNSIRATGRILGMAKDTLCHWLDRLGPHCKGLHAYLFHDLHLTESLMALLTVLFLWFLRQQEFTLAAFASGLATACRPTGVALIPALAWAYYASNRAQPMPVGRNLLFGAGLLALSVSGLVTYALYLQWRFDDALAFVRVQSSWASWSEGWE